VTDLSARRQAHARAWMDENKPAKGRAWSERFYAYDYQEDDMLYLVWYDDNPKHTIETKITDAITRYQERYGTRPNVALVSEHDHAPECVAGVRTQVEKRVGRNNIHVGYEAA
jgi:hypothetical protein